MVKRVYDKGGCVGCPTEMGCLGEFCPYCWEYHIYCDSCGREVDEVTRIDDTDYCEECAKSIITRIDYDNCELYVEEGEE